MFLYRLSALGIPLPIPVNGRPEKAQFEYIIGFLAIDVQYLI
jgi:hypothetical protein